MEPVARGMYVSRHLGDAYGRPREIREWLFGERRQLLAAANVEPTSQAVTPKRKPAVLRDTQRRSRLCGQTSTPELTR
jgi:hypothetical protein